MVTDLQRLLDNTPAAYYWAGFLAADGTVIDGRRIALQLAARDIGHVERFASYIGGHLDNNQRVTAQDRVIVPRFAKRFDLRPAKTSHPPTSLPGAAPDLVFSFVVGFIDGDGSIRHQSGRSDVFLSVKCHREWLQVLKQMERLLTGRAPTARINKRGYALFDIADSQILKKIKRRVIALELPALDRKWSKIDLEFVGRKERGARRVVEARALLAAGLRNGEIARALGVTPAAVTMIIKRHKLTRAGETREAVT